MPEKTSILCFGDSLTWGWVPARNGPPSERYPYDQRWTGAMAGRLGDGFHIIEEGLNARTSAFDDPADPRLNGANYLPTALASPWPSGPVVVSTPGVSPYSGCPGVAEPN